MTCSLAFDIITANESDKLVNLFLSPSFAAQKIGGEEKNV